MSVEQGGAPPVLGVPQAAVRVPGLGPVAGQEEAEQQAPHTLTVSVTLTVRQYQSHPAQRPETDTPQREDNTMGTSNQ